MDLVGQLPEPVRLRAQAAGDPGQQWLNSLPGLLSRLEETWSFSAGAVLSGGSEALVMEVTLADSSEAILKIALPDEEGVTNEALVLELAAGRGYARLLAHESNSSALLLERLGSKLADSIADIDEQNRMICETLRSAWFPVDGNPGLMTGAEKALWLGDFIRKSANDPDQPLKRAVIDHALDFCDRRATAWSPDNAVVVHGDAHAANTLFVDDENPDAGCRLIDPEGLYAERAADLAPVMRDNNGLLLEGDTMKLAWQRAESLSTLTGEDVDAIWQWGYIERVSTGLLLRQLTMTSEADGFLKVAARTTP